jgi:transposase, IS5 family
MLKKIPPHQHKLYEFGNKSSFAYTRKTGIIVGAMAIKGKMFDGHAFEPTELKK